jgi:hypothetical protein
MPDSDQGRSTGQQRKAYDDKLASVVYICYSRLSLKATASDLLVMMGPSVQGGHWVYSRGIVSIEENA